jgi:class 3 adenylate cyclase
VAERSSALVTILFTDLVGSTELLARAGDEEAQRIFRAHHDLLAKTAAAHGGEEVKWLGDGLMVAFPSSAGDAVRCAVAMQQASHRPVHGESLAIRVGLNAGEALRETADYFGTAVVIARRLCDRADAGQILCTETVVGLLAGRTEFSFAELGKLELKGVPEPVATREVRYEVDAALGVAWRTEFFGRDDELRRLSVRWSEAVAGRGGLVTLAGEPGIGKTRLTTEAGDRARTEGALVLWGHCLETEWSPPYAPFAEALDSQVAASEVDKLRSDLGAGAGTVAQLVPRIRQVLPDIPEPVPVQPDEERFRLFDAVAQFLVARSRRDPVFLCLDDLHWADAGTTAMLRHVARSAVGQRLLIVGTYRDAEVDRTHPLTDALAALRREVEYERVDLKGLDAEGVGGLVAAFAEHEVSPGFVAAVSEETDGNPFFVRELIRYLVEAGTIYRGPDGRWTSGRPVQELGLPEGVREVIGRRLSRLSDTARQLLSAASAFEGPFGFDAVSTAAGLDEMQALDALDEALAAQLVQPAGGAAEAHMFAHSLIRHTIYSELSSPRRTRLHRRIAEVLESECGGDPNPTQAGEIAPHYHRSATLPGSERGVDLALLAADQAEGTAAHATAARLLRMALDLLPAGDHRRPRLLSRLGIMLAWALAFDEAAEVASEAGEAIALAEGPAPAKTYLSEATYAFACAGSNPHAWAVAARGLTHADHADDGHDVAWALLVSFDQERRAAEDPDRPGIAVDNPDRREAARILQAADLDPFGFAPMVSVFDSRAEVAAITNFAVLAYGSGEYARCLTAFSEEAEAALTRGQVARAARCMGFAASCQIALGDLSGGRASLGRGKELVSRLGQLTSQLLYPDEHLTVAMNAGWDEVGSILESLAAAPRPSFAWAMGFVYAGLSRIAALEDRGDDALRLLGLLVPWLQLAPAWTVGFPLLPAHAAETLWLLERLNHAPVIERALRDKVVTPDFRAPMVDGRLALARLCAVQGRHDEARSWFAAAREVLAGQGARPLLAIADFDEALMHARIDGPGDAERARPLLDRAQLQFVELGMAGWSVRADELLSRLE